MKTGYLVMMLVLSLFIGLINLTASDALSIGNNITNESYYSIMSPLNNQTYYSIKVKTIINSSMELYSIRYANLDKKNQKCSENDQILDSCFKTLCKNCNSFGMDKERKLTMIEGINHLIFELKDYNGNTAIANRTFVVDTKKPKILSVFPRTNAYTNGINFMINYSEEMLQSITLVYGNDNRMRNITQACTAGKKQGCIFKANLSEFNNEPIYSYFILKNLIYAETSGIKRMIADTTAPKLTVNDPGQGKNYFKKVFINITSSEPIKLEYMEKGDSQPKFKTICTNCNDYGFSKKASKNIVQGRHDWIIRATDYAGNQDIKEVSFNVE